MTSSDLAWQDARGQIFVADLHYYDLMVWCRVTEFGMVTQVMVKHVSKGQPCTFPRGWGPSTPKIFPPLPAPKWFDLE